MGVPHQHPNSLNNMKAFLSAAISLLLVSFAQAQQCSIDWSKIAAGGGSSGSSLYAVSGTIGQPDASGTMTGGNFSLVGGFWSLVEVVQNPSSPLLSIHATTTNTIIISWPAPSTGFALEHNSDLSAANWSSVPNSVTVIGGENQVVLSPQAGANFYRLKH
jgi:hypothetical protein